MPTRTPATTGQRLPPRRQVEAIRAAVLDWFAGAQRALPWRERCEPYQVWVAEIMLQQTQVDTVLPYFERWMARFPDVAAVAAAPEQAVLKAWEGLGYYARARNLRRAAQAVVARHGGRIPDTAEALAALPGVGRYTAGAIASIGFNRRAAVVDGNVARVLGRLVALDVPARSPAGQARLWHLAEALVPEPPAPGDAAAQERGPRHFNQGLMELGALVCRKAAPACLLCPLQAHCAALRAGAPERFPPVAARRARPVRRGAMVLLARDGRWLLRRRPPRGVWGGLWEFPWAERAEDESPVQAAGRLLAGLGQDDGQRALRRLGTLEHGLTHFALVLECYALALDGAPAEAPAKAPTGGNGRAAAGEDMLRWVSRTELDGLPMARLSHKALALLEGR